LQSAYDGRELFARAGSQLGAVDSAVIRVAEKQIESCEHCNPENAEVPFDWILDRVTGHSGSDDGLHSRSQREVSELQKGDLREDVG
jgi:hypothetical protein